MAVDAFLDLNGIPGESTDEKFKDKIVVLSWSWGVSNPTQTVTGTGSGSGKASVSDLNIMKMMDKASATLLKNSFNGTHISKGTLSLVKSGGDGSPFVTFEMTEIFISSLQLSASSEVPMESVSMSFKSCHLKYSQQTETGSLTAAGDAKIDLLTNKAS